METAPGDRTSSTTASGSLALWLGVVSAVPWALMQYRTGEPVPYRYATFIGFDPVAGVLDVLVFLVALIAGVSAVLLGWRALTAASAKSAAAAAGVTLGLVSVVAYVMPALPQVLDVHTGISIGW